MLRPLLLNHLKHSASCSEWLFPSPLLKKDNVIQIRQRRGCCDILLTNYFWRICRDAGERGESAGHIRIYQHLWDPHGSSPVIHLALSSPDPVCFLSVWPIVTESNCRQKTTSNDYFIWEPEREREWKVTDRYFQQKEKAFLFPTHNFRQQRILLTWLRLEHQNKWQSTRRGQSAQRRESVSGNSPVPRRLPPSYCYDCLKVCCRLRQLLRINNAVQT